MGWIDIHTHMIPNFDDGARDEEASLGLLKHSYEIGVRDIILTSHYNEAFGFLGKVSDHMDEMRELALKVSPDLKVHCGNEIFYSSSTTELLQDRKISTLANSNYVLIEFSYSISKENMLFAVNEVLMSGYWPIIAHVERYDCMYQSGFAKQLVELGAYLQINAESLLSKKFKTKRFVNKLIKKDLLSFVASDCHGIHRRPQNLDKGAKAIEIKYGKDKVEKYLSENPRCILNNQKL